VSTANNKPTESVSLNAFKQPRAFYLIFSIELWERFGYYGLQGIMAVYLVKQLGMSEADSITLFSSFSALVYGLVAIGGWLGDKVLGTKRVIMLGAIVLAIGYALVAWSGHDAAIVYMGMATIAVGNGLFKANPSSLLSTCYDKNDPRLDGAFTMYYMSINIGSFFSMLATPWLAAFRLERRVCPERGRDADHHGELRLLPEMGKTVRFETGLCPGAWANCWRPSLAWWCWSLSPPGCCTTRVSHVWCWASRWVSW
jgi:POT family proton-dependent oligopeptide transporter